MSFNFSMHPSTITTIKRMSRQAFFWTSEKKTRGKKTQALKKLKQIFQKTQDIFPKTLKSANSFLT